MSSRSSNTGCYLCCTVYCSLAGTLALIVGHLMSTRQLATFTVPAAERNWDLALKARACHHAAFFYFLIAVGLLGRWYVLVHLTPRDLEAERIEKRNADPLFKYYQVSLQTPISAMNRTTNNNSKAAGPLDVPPPEELTPHAAQDYAERAPLLTRRRDGTEYRGTELK